MIKAEMESKADEELGPVNNRELRCFIIILLLLSDYG